jgi:hypothetical protein
MAVSLFILNFRTSAMNKLIFKLILLFMAFIICDFLIGLGLDIIRDNSPDGRYYKAQYSLEKGKEDIVIFGASRAEVNIVPYIFEDSLKMTCWNTGRGNQTLPFWICMEQGILNRYTPKIAIVDIEAEYLSSDLSRSFEPAGLLRPFYHRHKEIRPMINKISFFEQYLIYSNLYAYNSSYYYLMRPYLLKGLDGKKADKGWKSLNGQMSQIVSNPTTINSNKPLNNETVKLFNEFVLNLTIKGCQVFIVISPRFSEKIINTSTIEYIKNMKNVYLISFEDNKLFTENSRFYRDSEHLNMEGAVKLSSLIVKKIREKIM